MHLRVNSTHSAYQVPSHLGSHPIVITSVYQRVTPKGFLGASLTRQLVNWILERKAAGNLVCSHRYPRIQLHTYRWCFSVSCLLLCLLNHWTWKLWLFSRTTNMMAPEVGKLCFYLERSIPKRLSFAENVRYKPQPNKLSLIMASGLMMFFVVDIFVFISVARLLLEARYSAEEPESMEFRNPYIGLDELYSYHKIKPSRYNTLINEPRLSAQISSAEPSRVFPIDAHRWLSDFGVLSPPDRHLQVTNDVRDLSHYAMKDSAEMWFI